MAFTSALCKRDVNAIELRRKVSKLDKKRRLSLCGGTFSLPWTQWVLTYNIMQRDYMRQSSVVMDNGGMQYHISCIRLTMTFISDADF